MTHHFHIEHWKEIGGSILLLGGVITVLHKWVLKPLSKWFYDRRMLATRIADIHKAQILPDGRVITDVVVDIHDAVKVIEVRVGRGEIIESSRMEREGYATFVCDFDGKFTMVSMSLAHMVGCTIRELRDFGWKNHFAFNGSLDGVEFQEALDEARLTNLDGIISGSDGSTNIVTVQIAPHKIHDKAVEFVGIVKPISCPG